MRVLGKMLANFEVVSYAQIYSTALQLNILYVTSVGIHQCICLPRLERLWNDGYCDAGCRETLPSNEVEGLGDPACQAGEVF